MPQASASFPRPPSGPPFWEGGRLAGSEVGLLSKIKVTVGNDKCMARCIVET